MKLYLFIVLIVLEMPCVNDQMWNSLPDTKGVSKRQKYDIIDRNNYERRQKVRYPVVHL